MPSPGYIQGQYFTYEQLYSSSGTIVYDLYAQIPQGSGSITGSITGAVLNTSKLTEVEEAVTTEIPSGFVAAQVVGKGKALGTLIGSLSGKTIVAGPKDRKSTRLNSSHTVIYTLSLHDALPIYGDTFGIRCCPGGRKREGAWHSDRQPLWQNYSCRAEYTSHKALHRSKHRACCSNEHSGHCCSPGKGQITAEPGSLTTQKGAPNGCNTHR